MMTTDARGLYVHIPFCVKKCSYCDFCSYSYSSIDWRDKYIDVLCEEIASYKKDNLAIDTIFFGGGTPSLLTPTEFCKIADVIKESFRVLPGCEFTVEANPRTLDREKLTAFVNSGVNRLSIGLQSIHKNELKILGRIHDYDDFLASYRLAEECGINNLNVDLMYGIPEQTKESFLQTLEQIASLSPDHISLYGLILEEGTPLYDRRCQIAFPTQDEECDMYYLATDYLGSLGYSHYEISNYARRGRECAHNLKYWRDREYIGVGLAAYSYYKNLRFGNSDRIDEYLSGCFGLKDREELSNEDRAYEYVMLGLRLAEGISLSEYKSRFGMDFILGREKKLDKLCKAGYLIISSDRLSLTEKGFYVSNSIINELI